MLDRKYHNLQSRKSGWVNSLQLWSFISVTGGDDMMMMMLLLHQVLSCRDFPQNLCELRWVAGEIAQQKRTCIAFTTGSFILAKEQEWEDKCCKIYFIVSSLAFSFAELGINWPTSLLLLSPCLIPHHHYLTTLAINKFTWTPELRPFIAMLLPCHSLPICLSK